MTDSSNICRPAWDLPAGVHAFVTTRLTGCSDGPWSSFNLAEHVGDAAEAVTANRIALQQQMGELAELTHPPELQWVRQVHGTAVLRAAQPVQLPAPEADAVYSSSPGLAIGVLTADCLPVLLCADDGSEVAAAHAGWRGLLNGVLEATVASFNNPPERLRAWLGPAIGPCHFEVGEEVRAAFLDSASPADVATTSAAFVAAALPSKWYADLHVLARIRLNRVGIRHIAGETLCTSCNTDRFYSFRQQPVTGRFATLILRSC